MTPDRTSLATMGGGGPMANRPCAAITRAGGRCLRIASEGSAYCFSHDPERSRERSRNAAKAGKIGGNGRPSAASEIGGLKSFASGLIGGLLKGEIPRDRGAVAIQGINALRGLIELERRIKETDELETRIASLEASAEARQDGAGAGYRGRQNH
jgi:hypothetical protein